MITAATYKGRSYFLDPTNKTAFQKNSEKILSRQIERSLLLEDVGLFDIPLIDGQFIEYEMKVFPIKSMRFNDKTTLRDLKKALELPSVSPEKIEETKKRVITVCENNMGIFESFYKHNREAYLELSDKLITIKPKTKTRR